MIEMEKLPFTCEGMRYKQPNKQERIKGALTKFCENVRSKVKNIET